ncbi:retrovirus-related pol polyprotein from transposon TNT 1-94, partial [Tanacetum coccineum]
DRIRVEDTTEGRKHNRNKSKSWKIREIKYRQNITYSNCNQKGHFQNQCLMLVASRDKEVNMARDSDDALVCCVENTVEDRIMDSGASFHATYRKEELERFKLRSVKVRLADDKTLDIAGVGDVVLKTSFGTSCTLKDVRYIPGLKRRLISVGQLDEEGYHVGFRDQQWKVTKGSLVVAHGNNRESLIGMSMLASKGNIPDIQKVDIYFCKPGGLGKQKKLSFIMSVKTRKVQRSCDRYNANLQVKGLKFDNDGEAESTWICVEALKMLWADSVSTTYLIYRIPYVSIGLHILEEEWRGTDTSLTHLKVFGCDSFVKVKDVCVEAMKCTFIGSGSDEVSVTDSSSLTKPIQKSQVVLVDILENLAENDSIVAEHGLSSEITQSPGGSLDTSEESENNGSFEDSGRSDEEYPEEGASSKEGGSETPKVRRSTKESRAPVRYSLLTNYLLLTDNGEPESYSEALSSKESVQWKNAIIEEIVSLEKNQTCSLEPFYVRALNDTSTKHKSEGFHLVGQKENLECRLIEGTYVRTDSSTEAMMVHHALLLNVEDMLVAGSDMAEFNKPKWYFPLGFEMKDRCSKKQVLGANGTIRRHVCVVSDKSVGTRFPNTKVGTEAVCLEEMGCPSMEGYQSILAVSSSPSIILDQCLPS